MSDYDDIEDAVDAMILHQRRESREGRGVDLVNRERLLALIRQKLEAASKVAQNVTPFAQPAADVAQNDAEHERAVEVHGLAANSAKVAQTAAGDLLRAAKDVLHNFHVDMEHEQRRGFYGPQDVDAMHAMGDAIEAMKEPGVYAIDGRIVGVVDATATPIGRMVRFTL